MDVVYTSSKNGHRWSCKTGLHAYLEKSACLLVLLIRWFSSRCCRVGCGMCTSDSVKTHSKRVCGLRNIVPSMNTAQESMSDLAKSYGGGVGTPTMHNQHECLGIPLATLRHRHHRRTESGGRMDADLAPRFFIKFYTQRWANATDDCTLFIAASTSFRTYSFRSPSSSMALAKQGSLRKLPASQSHSFHLRRSITAVLIRCC
jgi:hypothetical protein